MPLQLLPFLDMVSSNSAMLLVQAADLIHNHSQLHLHHRASNEISNTASSPFSLASDSLLRLIPWADTMLFTLFFNAVRSLTSVSRV